MNKRNFGSVIAAIELQPKLWKQRRIPHIGETPTCGTPFCFLGHAEFLRTGEPLRGPEGCELADTYDEPALLKWLGLTRDEAIIAYASTNRLRDFKRWHKAGKVQP